MPPPTNHPPKPAPPPKPDTLPHPITFFVNAHQRTLILRALRTIHPDRATALTTLATRARATDTPPRPR